MGVLGLLTTSRKATAGALSAFLGPLAALYLSTADLTISGVVAALLTGAVGGLTVWAAPNTEPYEPRHRDAGQAG